jgi:serine protease Do
MKTWFSQNWKQWSRRMIAPVLALGMIGSLTAYETFKPAVAKAAASEPSTAPLDDNSVSAILSLDHAMETLASRVTPAVVNVAVTSKAKADEQAQGEIPDDMRQFFGPGFNFNMPRQQGPQIEHGIGSGVIISPDGYIITNNHVVEGAVDIRVTMSDRRVLPAKLIGTDPLTDLAVIKMEGHGFPNVPWGDATTLHPGQTVLAFGNPFGMRFTVTRGIVSALNRPNPSPNDARKPGQFIQTDAAINPGNSGGPLVNAHGEVVGINTFLISQSGSFSGMGFAIPTQIVRPTVEELIRDGKVSHGFMGVGITDVTPENAKFFESKDNRGAIVTQVTPNAPGAKAGLRVGDLITSIDGHNVSDASSLQVVVEQTKPGNTIKLAVMRDGKNMEIPVTLEKMGARDKDEEIASAEGGKPRWGVGLGELTPDVRQQLQANSELKGAVIERVLPGSPADNAGLRPGDVILSVNRHETQSVSDVQKALANVPKGQDALLLVYSNGGNTFRVLHSSQGEGA